MAPSDAHPRLAPGLQCRRARRRRFRNRRHQRCRQQPEQEPPPLHRAPSRKDSRSFRRARSSFRPTSPTMTDTDQSGPVEGPNETDAGSTRRAASATTGSRKAAPGPLTRPLPGPPVPLRWRLQRREQGRRPASRPARRPQAATRSRGSGSNRRRETLSKWYRAGPPRSRTATWSTHWRGPMPGDG